MKTKILSLVAIALSLACLAPRAPAQSNQQLQSMQSAVLGSSGPVQLTPLATGAHALVDQTFTPILNVFSGTAVWGSGYNQTLTGTIIQTSTSAAAFASGRQGNTDPVFRLVNNVSSQATGVSITGRAAGAGADITTLSSGTNEPLTIEAKGSGAIRLNLAATGAVLVGDATNPAFTVVHTTEGTGVSVTSAAAAGGAAIAAISSGTNENLTIDAKGSGTITLNGTGTGNIVLGRATTTAFTVTQTSASATAFESGRQGATDPVFRLVNNVSNQATGISITGRAATAGVDITVISSGTDENMVINAKGSGGISLNPTGTGNITLARATAASSTLSVTGAITPTGGVAAAGGFSSSPRLVHSGGASPATATSGTDTTPSVTETHIVEVFVPCNMTVTGVALLNGSATAGNYQISMADSTGAPIVAAQTASTAGSGTAAYQRIPFASPWAATGPATYYILLQNNNTGNRFRTHAFGNFGASVKTGEVFGTFTTVTAPTTFTADKGPIMSLY